jgi:hypothetical protein
MYFARGNVPHADVNSPLSTGRTFQKARAEPNSKQRILERWLSGTFVECDNRIGSWTGALSARVLGKEGKSRAVKEPKSRAILLTFFLRDCSEF